MNDNVYKHLSKLLLSTFWPFTERFDLIFLGHYSKCTETTKSKHMNAVPQTMIFAHLCIVVAIQMN